MSTVTAASTIACANAVHRLGIGRRGHRLAADVKADAERVGRLAGGEQQRLHLVRLGAELGGKAELGMIRADADAHQEVEIARRNAVRAGRADDLLQLFERVEAEGLHTMFEIGLGDRFLGLHRVHEAEHRFRQRLDGPGGPRRSTRRRNA